MGPFFFTISLIPSICLLINLILGIYKKIYQRKNLVWIFIYIIVSLAFDIIQKVLAKMGIPNIYLGHFYIPLEFILLSLFYQHILRNEAHKVLFSLVSIIFLILTVYSSLYLQGLNFFNTYARFVESLIILGYSITYLIKTIPKIETIREFQENNNNFAIVTGFCLYFLGSFLILSLSNSVLKFGDSDFNYLIWMLHVVFLVVLYTAIGIGIWITPKKYHFTPQFS